MESNIAASYYHSTLVFEKEQQHIFKKVWHFFGFNSELQSTNDFITRSIGGTPVVVQNLKGEIKAFLNICSHRFSILQQEEYGNRPLVCPYHGWSYDTSGIPSGIPKRPLFKNFSQQELCEMRLKQFNVSFCGNLCFVSLSENPQSLKDYLGDFFEELQMISFSMNERIDLNQLEIESNWKIIIENTLESYHVGLVHTNTFKKLGATGLKFDFYPPHSNWEADLTIKRTDSSNRKIEEMFDPRIYYIDGYKHFLIYPNLLISTTHGTSYNVSLIEPMTPTRSKFTSYVFLPPANVYAKKSLWLAFSQSVKEFNRRVFKEDKDICELVQKGVLNTTLKGVLSEEEERVHAFQRDYIMQIENES